MPSITSPNQFFMNTTEKQIASGINTESSSSPKPNLPDGNEQTQSHNNSNISISGLQVIQAYRTIRKLSVSSTWVKPARPGVWWNAVGFTI